MIVLGSLWMLSKCLSARHCSQFLEIPNKVNYRTREKVTWLSWFGKLIPIDGLRREVKQSAWQKLGSLCHEHRTNVVVKLQSEKTTRINTSGETICFALYAFILEVSVLTTLHIPKMHRP